MHSNKLARATQWNQWPYTLTYICGAILWNSSFFHFLFIYSLPNSLLCKCIEFPLPTILPPYSEQEKLTKYSVSIQVLMFASILPISLQQIEYEKIHAAHSNELAKSYTMKPISIFISNINHLNTRYENITKIAHFSQYFGHISSKNCTCKKNRVIWNTRRYAGPD